MTSLTGRHARQQMEKEANMNEEFYTQADLVKILKISPRTLERYRQEGTGPAFVKTGRRALYRASDVAKWVDARTFRSTSEMKAAI